MRWEESCESCDTGVDTPTFISLWQEISAVLVALGLVQGSIDRLKAERCGEEDYLEVLRDWAEGEEDIKSQLNNIKSQLTENTSKLEEVQEQLKQTFEDSKVKREK